MRKNILWMFSAALLLAGCSEESEFDKPEQSGGETITFEASSAVGANTRTLLDEYGFITWENTDQVRVNGTASSKTEITEGGNIATFIVNGVQGPYDAFYPSNMVSSYNKSTRKYSINLPVEQKYRNDISFAQSANPSTGTITYQSGTDKYKVGFYNLCGLFRINLRATREAVKWARYVRMTATTPISGNFKADPQTHTLTGGSTYEIYFDLLTDRTITMNSGITANVVLPPGTYDWSLQLMDKDKLGVTLVKSGTGLIVRRGKITSATMDFQKQIRLDESHYKFWSLNNPGIGDMKNYFTFGVYWDDNGTPWVDKDGKVRRTGIWINNSQHGDGAMPDSGIPPKYPTPDHIRTSGDWGFLPAGGMWMEGALGISTGWYYIGQRGLYWTNVEDYVTGYKCAIEFTKEKVKVVEYTDKDRCIQWRRGYWSR